MLLAVFAIACGGKEEDKDRKRSTDDKSESDERRKARERRRRRLISLREAYGKLQFSRLPPGTQGMLITYADKATSSSTSTSRRHERARTVTARRAAVTFARMKRSLFLVPWGIVLCMLIAACGPKGGGTAKPAGNNVAVAVVMNGWEVWVGNDRVLPDGDPARYPGALDYVKAGLDGAHLGELPGGSLGTLIVYADRATVKLAMGPIAKLNGEAVGGQKDYMGTVGSSLVDGVELAVKELTNTKAARKVMIVLGDGNDTNKDTAKARLEELHKQAMAEKIEVHAIVYKTSLSDQDSAITALVPEAVVASSVDDVKAQLATMLGKLR